MSETALGTPQMGRRTLGPLVYATPLMPPVLTFGPLLIVIPIQSVVSIVAASILGIGLLVLWLSVMRVVQRLDREGEAEGE